MDFPELRLKPAATQPGTQPDTIQDEVRNKPEELTRIKTLAAQFESMLLSQMLKQMKDSMAPHDDSEGLGESIFGDTINSELAMSLTKAGGVGLAESLLKGLSRIDQQPGQSEVAAAMAATPATVSMPMPTSRSFTLDRAVSSDFGWRHDPINGQPRFHAGLDLKVAYGQQVRAASGGVVTFAGEQAGYGTTVVVDHGDGLETRYAHLSSTEVQAGSVVSAGQSIARSGNSGRSTGAHLHFEVRQDGQPIDPDRVTGFAPVADLPGLDRH